MGNASAREDGGDSPSEVEVEEGQFHGKGVKSMEEAGHSGAHVNNYGHGGSSEWMGQSPPHSPGATLSPLMFTPQVPVLPLQKPDELHIPSHSWMQTATDYEDMFCEQGIPTIITWTYGGMAVFVEGSWDNWKIKKPLQSSGKDFTIMMVLPSGVYQYWFIVDGERKYAPDLPWSHDDMGNAFNILDLQEYVPEDLESISGFEPPQSPESSYNNLHLGSEDYAKEPPLVPPHLQMTLLNVPSSCMDNLSPLSRPPHVVLNHIFVQKGKSGQSMVALGSTHRFRAKYVTVVLYKSLQR